MANRTRTTIHLVGGLSISLEDDTEPNNANYEVIVNEIIKSLPGGIHVMDNFDTAGRYVDGRKILRKIQLAHGEYIVAATVEELPS
jgi:pSer/pThr/pTyr-binding forkhead associated (FHA) protein